MRGIIKSPMRHDNQDRNAGCGAAKNDSFSVIIELAQAFALVAAIAQSYLGDVWLLANVAPFLPLVVMLIGIMTRIHHRGPRTRRPPSGDN